MVWRRRIHCLSESDYFFWAVMPYSTAATNTKLTLSSHLVPEWGDVSSGMHQFLTWTALELEGLGCNLQHFNFMPEFSDAVKKQWQFPESWKLKSQLVFGKPVGGLVRKKERTYAPLDERVKVIGRS